MTFHYTHGIYFIKLHPTAGNNYLIRRLQRNCISINKTIGRSKKYVIPLYHYYILYITFVYRVNIAGKCSPLFNAEVCQIFTISAISAKRGLCTLNATWPGPGQSTQFITSLTVTHIDNDSFAFKRNKQISSSLKFQTNKRDCEIPCR